MLSVSTPMSDTDPAGRDTARAHSRRPALMAVLLLAPAGAALLWLVVTFSYAASLADSNPEASLRIRVTAPALLNLVERRLAALRKAGATDAGAEVGMLPDAADTRTGRDDRDRISVLADLASRRFSSAQAAPQSDAITPRSPEKEHLYQMTREALRREPLNARALRLLAELSEGHAPHSEVARLMRMAVRRNVHEPIAVFWLLNEALAEKNYKDVLTYADILLRTEIRLNAHAIHALAKACEDSQGLELVLQAVRANPRWRDAFVSNVSQYVTDARIPLQILVGLKDSAHPPTTKELAPFFALLMRHQLHELAYYTWIQFLPPEQLVRVVVPFNGDFETTPSGLPFDWIIPSSPNAIAGIVSLPPPATGKALRVEFGLGRIDFAGARQLVLLPPGEYTFSATYTASINGRRGLVWALACIDGTELGRTAMMQGSVLKPTPIHFSFRVPEAGCRAQQLRLFHDSRSASEQFVSGWSNQQDVRITPREDPQ